MASEPSQSERGAVNRPVLIALAGLIVLAIAIGMSVWNNQRDESTPAQAPAALTASTDQAKTVAAPIAPSFDIVRINPQGETVIAGRAMPKAEVSILDGGKEIGRVTADNRGEWVFVPDQPLPPGSRDLTLKATNPDGSVTETDSPVVLMVPDRSKDHGASVAVKIAPDGSIDILQGPDAKTPPGAVTIAAVKYDDKGRLSVAGTAKPKAHLQIYLDNQSIGHVFADDHGRWKLTRPLAVNGGNHTVRVDQLGPDGKVRERAEIAFSPSGSLPADGKITVEAGSSLWRLARKAYGSGFDYLVIYEANKDQIRDPDRIYPGQVFNLPPQH
jgi:hypothetical protein